MALRIWQSFYSFVLSMRNEYPRVSTGYYFPPVIQMYTKFAKFARLYFYIFEQFTTKLCNFTKLRMLFQDAVIFLPVTNFFKISSKRLKVHYMHIQVVIVYYSCPHIVRYLLNSVDYHRFGGYFPFFLNVPHYIKSYRTREYYVTVS